MKPDGTVWIKPIVEKVQIPQTKDGIFVPIYASKLLKYFVEHVRPALQPRTDVLSIWINAYTQDNYHSYNYEYINIMRTVIACFFKSNSL